MGPDGQLGRTKLTEHQIRTGDAPPIRQPTRRLPILSVKEAEEQVEKMLRDGVIEPSASPWSLPLVLVRKKDATLRFCADYRKVNKRHSQRCIPYSPDRG